jgi:hypothetical protein
MTERNTYWRPDGRGAECRACRSALNQKAYQPRPRALSLLGQAVFDAIGDGGALRQIAQRAGEPNLESVWCALRTLARRGMIERHPEHSSIASIYWVRAGG